MNEALALLAYALVAGTAAAAWLRRARWTRRAPRLGVAAWQALSVSVLMSLLLAGVSVVVPTELVSTSLAELLRACAMAIQAQYATPGGAVLHAAAAAATIVLAVRTGYMYARALTRARRQAQQHLEGLTLAGRRDPSLGALVVEHPTAAAYCLPGRSRTIVLTSAAVASLGPVELAAVLAHERAHLTGRHHLVLSSAVALSHSMPVLPIFRWAHHEQSSLLEMIADDRAATTVGSRLTVARALVRLAEGALAPPAALGATDVAAISRVERLLAPQRLLTAPARVGTACLTLAVLLLPVTIAAAPAGLAAWADYCPISLGSSRN